MHGWTDRQTHYMKHNKIPSGLVQLLLIKMADQRYGGHEFGTLEALMDPL